MQTLTRAGLLASSIGIVAACASSAPQPDAPAGVAPPVAEQKPHEVASPNGSRPDPYYWLRDDTRQSPEVLAHLNAENAYKDAVLAPTRPLQEKLYQEIVGRIKQDDSTPPMLHRGYWYYKRYEAGGEYPLYCRRKGTMDAPEEVLLDGNALAQGRGFFQIGSYDVSTSNELIAYTEDTVGRRQYTLRFKNLRTGETYADAVANVEPSITWANDDKTVLYVDKDPVTLLSERVKKHVLGTDAAKDALVYEEKDPSFYMGVGKSKSGQYLFIVLESTLVSEWRYAGASDPKLKFKPVLPREASHEYQVEHLGRTRSFVQHDRVALW
jgi:oligopeptidase B